LAGQWSLVCAKLQSAELSLAGHGEVSWGHYESNQENVEPEAMARPCLESSHSSVFYALNLSGWIHPSTESNLWSPNLGWEKRENSVISGSFMYKSHGRSKMHCTEWKTTYKDLKSFLTQTMKSGWRKCSWIKTIA
jgi:hypothetical protein